jgi:hypothetical protein
MRAARPLPRGSFVFCCPPQISPGASVWRMKNIASKNIDVYANVNICYLDPDIGPHATHGLGSGRDRMVEEKHADLRSTGPGHAVRAQ